MYGATTQHLERTGSYLQADSVCRVCFDHGSDQRLTADANIRWKGLDLASHKIALCSDGTARIVFVLKDITRYTYEIDTL